MKNLQKKPTLYTSGNISTAAATGAVQQTCTPWQTRFGVLALVIALTLLGSVVAPAQTAANADAVYNGWMNAYLVQNNGAPWIANSLSDRLEPFMWIDAYQITAVEDKYDRTPSPGTAAFITSLLNRFEVRNSADLSWDSWNDDAAWAVIALIRGYEITGNTTFKNDAIQAWNMAYNRGWDNTYGGGIWENMGNVPNGGKCGLSNWNFVFTGVMLYNATGDSTYLTKAKAIYAWARATIFNTTTGAMDEQVGPSGVNHSDNYYNSGLLINAANSLYQLTHNSQYYNDAVLAAQHVMNNYPILTVDKVANGSFGGDQVYRGLALFARQNNIWNNYSTWLNNNAAASWNHRRTDYDITHNDYSTATPTTGDLKAMETLSSVVVQEVTAQQSGSGGGSISGVHTIVSAQNGIAIDNDNTTALKAGIVEWALNSGPTQQWNFTQNSDGSWTIVNQMSGLAMDDPGSSTVTGTQMHQYTSNNGTNQHWLLNVQSDGSYQIVNKASNDALDNSGSSTNGTALVQQPLSNSTQQHWLLK